MRRRVSRRDLDQPAVVDLCWRLRSDGLVDQAVCPRDVRTGATGNYTPSKDRFPARKLSPELFALCDRAPTLITVC